VKVAVAIVGYRNVADILACLDALSASTYDDFEVIICENGGKAAYEDLQRSLPSTLKGGQMLRAVMARKNLGFAGGVNVCLSETPDAEAWWILNPDTQPAAGALGAKVRRLAKGDCDAVGCIIHLPIGKVQSYGGRWSPILGRSKALGRGADPFAAVDACWVERTQNYIDGAAMLVSRRFVDVVGPMREDYFLYCEEVEWCLRALNGGLRLGFAADAKVFHRQGATTGASGDAHKVAKLPLYLTMRNTILLTRDRTPRWTPVAGIALLAVLVRRFALRGAWRQFGHGFIGLVAGMRNERGAPQWLTI